jgi:hypothetical protein
VLEHVQIQDTGKGRLHEKEGAVRSLFAEGAKHVHLWIVTNIFQGDTWIFAAPDVAVVGTDLITDMKRALNTIPDVTSLDFSYGDTLTITILCKTQCILLHYESSKHSTRPLNKFI